jgi:hypothetical protein
MRLDAARRQRADAIEQPAALTEDLIGQIARDIAACLSERPACDAAQIAALAVGRVVGAIAERTAGGLLELRSLLADALKQAGGTTAPGDGQITELPSPSGMPALDVSEFASSLQVHRPALGFLGTGVLSHGIHKQLETSIAPDLRSAINRYGKRLDDWRSQFLGELHRAFSAAADLCSAARDRDDLPPADDPGFGSPDVQRDIEILQRHGAASPQAPDAKNVLI